VLRVVGVQRGARRGIYGVYSDREIRKLATFLLRNLVCKNHVILVSILIY